MTSIIVIIVIIAALAWETNKGIRKKGRPVTELLVAVILAFVALAISSGLDWNGSLPVPLWWGIAIWIAALLGVCTARIISGPQRSAGDITTPPAQPARPQAAAQTAPR